eukprot:NODE_5365_length_1778_cov_7.777105.p1 GENE.NODE_5365_length_1778_cov_7.777105~~NODE_5365_length_1778_cov_7.777105.p1  ORF type:complete len:512 (-),score=79.85 NODE_5365_length_1778_cov_7.777105:99-1634(-)
MIEATVSTLAGDFLALLAPPGSLVSYLEEVVEEKWSVPRAFQQLVRGTAKPASDDPLEAQHYVLAVTVDTEQLLPRPAMSLVELQKWVAVLGDIGVLGVKAGEPTREALRICCHDFRCNVKVAALRALRKVSRVGDPRSMATVTTVLCCRGDSKVAWAALTALASIAVRGDPIGLTAAASYLSHTDRRVRRAAAQALGAVAKFGDEFAIDQLVKRFEDSKVAEATMDALACITRKGDEHALDAVRACFTDASGRVRRTAARVLPLVAQRGDIRSIAAITTLFDDKSYEVRHFALRAYAALGEGSEDPQAFATLASCLSHWSWYVREPAVAAAGKVAPKGHQHALAPLLHDGDSEVRQAAIRAIARLAERGNARTVDTMVACLEDDDDFVRRAAFSVLPRVAERGDSRAIEAAVTRLEHKAWIWRGAAVRALERLVQHGDTAVVTALLPRLKDEDRNVRHVAVKALGKLATPDDVAVAAALGACVADDNEEHAIRDAAEAALACLRQHTPVP